MTIFAVMMPTPQPGIVKKIEEVFTDNYLRLSDTQYLVSASGTVIDVSRRLGIADPKSQPLKPTGNAVVIAMSSYFGRAPATVWEWIKSKLEASPNG